MSEHPVVLLAPFYQWLVWVIAKRGLYLYTMAVWLSPLLIVWILKGGFWRRPARLPRYVVKPPPLPKRPVATPPSLPESSSPPDDDSQSFAM
jgi:hypothetical protein